MSFYYSRKICIFLNGFIYDSRQKFQISFEPTFLLKETMGGGKGGSEGLLPSLTPLIHNFK